MGAILEISMWGGIIFESSGEAKGPCPPPNEKDYLNDRYKNSKNFEYGTAKDRKNIPFEIGF